MASPFVAGFAALLLQQDPSAPPAQIAAEIIALSTPDVVANAGSGTPNRLMYTALGAAPASPAPTPAPAAPSPTDFVPMVPARLFDSRPGMTTIDGTDAGTGPLAAGTTTEVQITGRNRIPTDATGVSLNITATQPAGPGFITVSPCGQPVPVASNLNYTTGTTVANAVLTQLGTGGRVCITTPTTTQLIIDINGYFPAA
jgi:hypothetical protein